LGIVDHRGAVFPSGSINQFIEIIEAGHHGREHLDQ